MAEDRPVTWPEIDERFKAARELTDFKFDAAIAAVEVASKAIEKRFESVNEFRQTLADQNTTFVRTLEYQALVEKVDLLTNQTTAISSRLSTVTSGPAFLIGSMTVLAMIVISLVGGAISLGSLQTHVEISSDEVQKLKAGETARIVEHANENVERGNFQTRQALAEDRIKQLEANGYIKPPDISSVLARLAVLETEMKNNAK
jgi:hypothetical protein